MTEQFFLVENGQAILADSDTEFDGINSVLCFAKNERAALKLAEEYDKGDRGVDNLWLPDEGRAVAALFRRGGEKR